MTDDLEKLRRRIDEIDVTLQNLIHERVELAKSIAKVKQQEGSKDFYRPEREAQILRGVIERNNGLLTDEQLVRIFRELISATLAAESPIIVAYLGPEGTYTQSAALRHFGSSAEFLPMTAIDQVFNAVEKEQAHYGVVPIENSVEGVITHTLDTFFHSPLKICGEIQLRIRHQLISHAESLSQIKRVISHSQSLAQCRLWLQQHLSDIELLTASSNAEAARQVTTDKDAAAIASSEAASHYHIPVLVSDIEDDAGNTTRFLVVGSKATQSSGEDKTSLMISSANKPGALHRLLTPLAERGVSMTRIESRPSRNKLWEYVFFIDIEGHVDDPEILKVLEELESQAGSVRLLGSYPRAVI